MNDTLQQMSPIKKKRRRKSSGKCKAAMKELVLKSKILSEALDDSEEEDSHETNRINVGGGRDSLPNLHMQNPSKLLAPAQDPAQDPTIEFAKIHKPHKPSANVTATKGRHYTVSVALPGSIVNNAQTWELKTALVGQIARACAIFSVNEIVIFDEAPAIPDQQNSYGRGKYRAPAEDQDDTGLDGTKFQPSHFVARILEYLECPQYLRKSLFPLHPDLRLAGLLPPLDLPHHFRKDHDTPWREGCILPAEKVDNYLNGQNNPKKKSKLGGKKTVWADVGLAEPVEVLINEKLSIPDWTRGTVQMPTGGAKLAQLVSPCLPTETTGIYWGYSTRLAGSISKVFTETPYASDGGYDLTIGTSERGQNVDDAIDRIGEFKHMLLVLGGLSGLELCIAADDTLEPRLTAADAHLLFDHWLNTLPFQGSRTVRTEEALLVSLGALRRLFIGI